MCVTVQKHILVSTVFIRPELIWLSGHVIKSILQMTYKHDTFEECFINADELSELYVVELVYNHF